MFKLSKIHDGGGVMSGAVKVGETSGEWRVQQGRNVSRREAEASRGSRRKEEREDNIRAGPNICSGRLAWQPPKTSEHDILMHSSRSPYSAMKMQLAHEASG